MPSPPVHPLPPERRDTLPPLDDDALDALFDAVAARTVDRAPTWRDRLRELPTPARTTTAAGAALLACAALLGAEGLRGDLDGAWPLAIGSLVLVGTGIGAVAVALRSHGAPPLSSLRAVVTAAIALPLLAALVPSIWAGDPAPVASAWMHVACGLGGLVAAVASAGLVLVFDRDDRPHTASLVLAAAAGGAFGFVVQTAHCAMTHPLHLLLGHASAGVIVGAVLVAWDRLRPGR